MGYCRPVDPLDPVFGDGFVTSGGLYEGFSIGDLVKINAGYSFDGYTGHVYAFGKPETTQNGMLAVKITHSPDGQPCDNGQWYRRDELEKLNQ